MLPAHQRLDADHALRGDVDLRLVVQDELAGADRGAQLAEQLQPLGGVRVAVRRVGLDAGARALGVVHRDVGALDQRVHVGPVLGAVGDPDAGVQHGRDAVEQERARDRVLQAAGELGGHPAVGQPAQQHGELVAAEPGERVAAAHDALQARGDLLQQAVARVVPERVVDLLEAVEVDQQQRGGLAAALGRGQRGLHPVVEQRAVGEVGEVVVQGLVAQAARGDGDDPEQRRVEEHEAEREQQVQPARVLGDRGGHRRVGEVDLDDAVGLLVALQAQRHVDLERVAALAVVEARLLDRALDVAGERGADVGRVEVGLADDRALVGVDDHAVLVEDLQAPDPEPVEVAQLELLVERGEVRVAVARGEIAREQDRLQAERGHRLGELGRLQQRAALDALVQHLADPEAEGDDDEEAQHAELGQQRWPAQERTHARLIGRWGPHP